MKINVVLAVVVCLFIAVFHSGCLESGKGKTVTMTMEELINDYDQSVDNDTKKITNWFKSLDDGDILIISEVLNNITYMESNNYTLIDFASSVGQPLPIEGDITDTFERGDSIELKLHIVKVIFPQQDPYSGETWTIELETFEEGWDNENNTSIPLPQKVIGPA